VSPPPSPAARLAIPVIQATPGAPAHALVSLTNTGDAPAVFLLRVIGVEPAWIQLPAQVGPVAPGETVAVAVGVHLPVGYPPARLVGSVGATPLVPIGVREVTTDLIVVVGDGSMISAHLEPAEVRGSFGGRTDVVLHNRGSEPLHVELIAETPSPSVQIRFERPDALVHPGGQARIRARIRAPRPVAGGTARRPYGVRVQGRSTPVVLEGSLVQRPLLAPGLVKVVALVTVVALWVAVAIVGISALSRRVHSSAAARAVADAPPAAAPGGPSAGSPSGGGSDAGGTGGGRGAAGGGFAAPGSRGTDRVSGTVTGPSNPGGVTVQVQPTTLADANTAGATLASAVRSDRGTNAAGATEAGMVWGSVVEAAAVAGLDAAGIPTLQVTTAPDGSWSVAGLRAPGTYLVTFSKLGYDTAKYLVTTTAPGQTLSLDATLSVASGSISGLVSGPAGPLGDVAVTVSNGPITVTTRTPSTGQGVGTWSIGGLSTPGTYLVSAALGDYGTQTTTVTLGPSGSAGGVRLVLRPGVATITGTVRSTSQSGVAGLTVTAADATTTVTTTTLSATGLVGDYTLPNLPVPGTYTLTVSGAGYVTESQTVSLTASRVISPTVVPASADVQGQVETRQPLPAHASACPGAQTPGAEQGVADAGVSLTDGTTTYKTLSETGANAGHFDFGAIPAGTYVLSATLYCYQTAISYITVSPPGSLRRAAPPDHVLDLVLAGAQSVNTVTITGSVVNEFTAAPLVGVPVVLDPGSSGGGSTVYTHAGGLYTFVGVPPGEHLVATGSAGCAFGTSTAETCDESTNAGGSAAEQEDFVAARVTVTAGLSGAVPAPTLELPSLDTFSGQVTNTAGQGIAGATVTLTPSDPAAESHPAPVTTAAGGGYTVSGLLPGQYTLSVSAPYYEPSAGRAVTLLLGQDYSASPVSLTEAPSVTVAAVANGQPVGGACVLLYDGSGAAPVAAVTETSPAPSPLGTGAEIPTGSAFVPGLVEGTGYTAVVFTLVGGGATPSDCVTAAAPSTPNGPGTYPPTGSSQLGEQRVSAETDQFIPDTVVLSRVSAALQVSLSYNFVEAVGTSTSGSLVACPLQAAPASGSPPGGCLDVAAAYLPTVTLSGTNLEGQPVSAVVPGPAAGNTWTFSSAAITSLALASPNVTISVSGPGFSNPSVPVTLTQASSTSATQPVELTLQPSASPVAGCVVGDGTATVTVGVVPDTVTGAGATSTVAVSDGPSTGTCPTGTQLTWVDSSETGAGVSLGQPGRYTLQVSGSGIYTSGPATTVVVGECAAGSAILCPGQPTPLTTITVLQEETLTVSGAGLAPGAAAEVYLVYQPTPGVGSTLAGSGNGGAVTGVEETTADSPVTTPAADQGVPLDADHQDVFSYLDPRDSGSYVLVVAAPGYETSFQTLTVGNGAASVTPSLDAQSDLTGTVSGSLLSTTQLVGAAVTATVATGGHCPVPADLPAGGGFTDASPVPQPTTTVAAGVVLPSGDTAGAGEYELTGNSTVTIGSGEVLSGNTNGGLCEGDRYNVTASQSPYTPGSVVATVGSPADTNADNNDLTLQPEYVSQAIDVTAGGGQFPAGATVTLSYTPIGGSSAQSGTCSTLAGQTSTTTTSSPPSTCTVTTTGTAAAGYDQVTFQLGGLLPVQYAFTLSATDCQTETLTASLAYAVDQGGTATPITAPLTVDQFEVAVTATAQPAGGGNPVPVPGLAVVLTNVGDGVETPGTTGANGVVGFGGLGAGTYSVAVAPGTGYSVVSGTTTVTTGSSYVVTLPLTVAATAPSVAVTVSSSIPGASDVVGSQVTLTPATGTVPATCASQSGSAPLLAGGLAPSAGYTATVSADSGTDVASFASVVPDFYTVTVAAASGQNPAPPEQAPSAVVAICPGTGPVALSSTIEQAELVGTVNEPQIAGAASTPPPTVSVAGATPTVTAGAASGGSVPFTWDDFVDPTAGSYTVQTTGPTGYTSDRQVIPLGSSASSTPTPVTTDLALNNVTVPVVVDDAGGPLAGATVQISSGPAGSAYPSYPVTPTGSSTTGANGTADFSLPPDESSTEQYVATATYTTAGGVTVTGTVAFDVSPATAGTTAPAETIQLAAGVYALSVTLTVKSGTPVPSQVQVQFCPSAACSSSDDVTVSEPVNSSDVASFDGEIPSADDVLVLSATGYKTKTVSGITIPTATAVGYTLDPA
jgi:hypothetical protein